MFNRLCELCETVKWFAGTLYNVIFADEKYDPYEQSSDEIFMTYNESKAKNKSLKEGIRLLKDTLKIVEKPVNFGGVYEPYNRFEDNTINKVYGEYESRFLYPKIRRLSPEELCEMEFDLAIDEEEEKE